MSSKNQKNQQKEKNGLSVEDAGAALSAASPTVPAPEAENEANTEPVQELTAAESSNYVAEFGEEMLTWTEAQLEYAATVPAIVAICKAVVAKAEPVPVVEEPKKLTPEEMESINYQRLVDAYGKDFVTATRGLEKKYFSRRSWGLMGAKKDGWIEVKKTMPEMNKGRK